mmetsp:Transcript_43630/g.138237  ORF Transcript_43630/g.138237 Transcript_43630/m.138237 type:complete len:256 (+) Transcript_43630:3158-3925(+)
MKSKFNAIDGTRSKMSGTETLTSTADMFIMAKRKRMMSAMDRTNATKVCSAAVTNPDKSFARSGLLKAAGSVLNGIARKIIMRFFLRGFFWVVGRLAQLDHDGDQHHDPHNHLREDTSATNPQAGATDEEPEQDDTQPLAYAHDERLTGLLPQEKAGDGGPKTHAFQPAMARPTSSIPKPVAPTFQSPRAGNGGDEIEGDREYDSNPWHHVDQLDNHVLDADDRVGLDWLPIDAQIPLVLEHFPLRNTATTFGHL